ncbi:DNA cytosine methyltransferase [Brachybacterium sp. GPGPB12]|uniref:DNA cytosine methyltransferase n=1 Tax=Brachybacterium sp. GPGPB12 TaxID=3023517 RepID=UPI003134280E
MITGIRRDIYEKLGHGFQVPKPTTPQRTQQKTAWEAIEKDPIHPEAYNNTRIKHRQSVVDRLEAIPAGKNAFNTQFKDESLRLNVKGVTLSNIYRRLARDEPSYTVTGSGGGGTHMYHWEEPRALTNRERARLQTFPDWFQFFGGTPSVRRQVGMAVPPEGAQVVLEAMLKTLDGTSYASVGRPSIDADELIRAYELAEHGEAAQMHLENAFSDQEQDDELRVLNHPHLSVAPGGREPEDPELGVVEAVEARRASS